MFDRTHGRARARRWGAVRARRSACVSHAIAPSTISITTSRNARPSSSWRRGIPDTPRNRSRSSCCWARSPAGRFRCPSSFFERVSITRRALGESATRTTGSHGLVLATLAVWALAAITMTLGDGRACGRSGPDHRAATPSSLALLLLFIALLALLGIGLALAAGIVEYLAFCTPHHGFVCSRSALRKCRSRLSRLASSGQRRLTSRGVAAIVAFAALGALSFALLAFLASREPEPLAPSSPIAALRPQRLRIRWRRFASRPSNKVISSNSTFRSLRTARCLWCTTVT